MTQLLQEGEGNDGGECLDDMDDDFSSLPPASTIKTPEKGKTEKRRRTSLALKKKGGKGHGHTVTAGQPSPLSTSSAENKGVVKRRSKHVTDPAPAVSSSMGKRTTKESRLTGKGRRSCTPSPAGNPDALLTSSQRLERKAKKTTLPKFQGYGSDAENDEGERMRLLREKEERQIQEAIQRSLEEAEAREKRMHRLSNPADDMKDKGMSIDPWPFRP